MHLAELLDRPQDVVAWQIDERELVALVPELSMRIRQLEALRVRLDQEAAFRGAVTLTAPPPPSAGSPSRRNSPPATPNA